ncbi:N-acetylglucosamine-6-phosphate deacetylase-like [Acanthaster planci]|uniref:N-acetylglucosamine-6-phosphate deacetylase n=1 Tax=Acanthaster planci TaxID=133434 RepID=A0A8B7XFM1_ACAPL|nr:N-acetylglucosamine-6-phosphate deacetylase-like [Acanthaster planci]XP_022079565.1 N-acetylglucosamine-6-phosphate deacetylase-like [Acanthaster planci]
MPSKVSDSPVTQFRNCRILYKHQIIKEDLWVRDGKILNPESLFFVEKGYADYQLNCDNCIISPGFIDAQINGAFGIDFSSDPDSLAIGLQRVSKKLLAYGVTSYCPTVITSSPETYRQILPQIKRTNGSHNGAGVLGIHLEGPFISKDKPGAHPIELIKHCEQPCSFEEFLQVYHSLDNVAIVTLAPESCQSADVVTRLSREGIVISLGHSVANLPQAEDAVKHGASFITHLFNAMLPFHHRDPGIVGLLTSDQVPPGQTIFYGMIADGIHTNPAALRIAYRAHPEGIVLVTDAIAATGLPSGIHQLGSVTVQVDGDRAYVAGTQTLCGSTAMMDSCVRHFKQATGCTTVEALEAATLHPAQLLNIHHLKGTLEYGTDADFILLDEGLNVKRTYIGGKMVWDASPAEEMTSRPFL